MYSSSISDCTALNAAHCDAVPGQEMKKAIIIYEANIQNKNLNETISLRF